MLRTFASLIQTVLDVILPRKQRTVRVDDYQIDDLLISPQEHDACGVRITTLMRYRTRAVEDTIRALKYDGSEHAAKILAGALAEFLREEITGIRMFSPLPIILVPIPLHEARMRERGFNQIEKVLCAMPEEFQDGTCARIETNLLVRTRATKQQTRLSRTGRIRNVADAFALQGKIRAHCIVIDDVTTTGATLAEAAKPFSAPVTLLALARA